MRDSPYKDLPPLERRPDGSLYRMTPAQRKQAASLIRRECCCCECMYSGMEYPLIQGNRLDLDTLCLVEHFKESPLVQETVIDLVRALPDLTVDDRENFLLMLTAPENHLKNAEVTMAQKDRKKCRFSPLFQTRKQEYSYRLCGGGCTPYFFAKI